MGRRTMRARSQGCTLRNSWVFMRREWIATQKSPASLHLTLSGHPGRSTNTSFVPAFSPFTQYRCTLQGHWKTQHKHTHTHTSWLSWHWFPTHFSEFKYLKWSHLLNRWCMRWVDYVGIKMRCMYVLSLGFCVPHTALPPMHYQAWSSKAGFSLALIGWRNVMRSEIRGVQLHKVRMLHTTKGHPTWVFTQRWCSRWTSFSKQTIRVLPMFVNTSLNFRAFSLVCFYLNQEVDSFQCMEQGSLIAHTFGPLLDSLRSSIPTTSPKCPGDPYNDCVDVKP